VGAPAPLHQHDLNASAATRVVAAAKLADAATVLDVGAGTGALTAALLAAGHRVHAIELDPNRAAGLRQRFSAEVHDDRLDVLVGDARHLLPLLPATWHIVANPPFMHSAELVRTWVLGDLAASAPASITCVLQAQTIDKWCGRDGAHTRSSVLAHLTGTPRCALNLKRDAVSPVSHVPLAVLHLTRHHDCPDPATVQRVDRLLARAFAGPHTVREALRGIATPAIIKRQSKDHGWDAHAHPRTVPPQAWLALATFLHGIGKLA
jgi:16S rRNA A1518/A1519 N6-dimethyltransferase RsmA/KsgA/DIM1 with predicted DNA glycosylase/AP lyase activity